MRKLAEYESVLNQVMRLFAKSIDFRCRPGLSEILSENPQLIVALNHSSPLSWLPSAATLALETIAGGGSQRVPMSVMENFFFQLPGLREVANYFTQTDRPLNYVEISTRFRDSGDIDLVLFPEGSNCFFGPPEEIKQFRSPKFVELSIETGAPILVGVHRGSENWAAMLPVPSELIERLDVLPSIISSYLEKRLRQSGQLAMPIFPRPMERFEMLCELYRPTLEKTDLSDDVDQRRSQIKAEADRVRNRMIELQTELTRVV